MLQLPQQQQQRTETKTGSSAEPQGLRIPIGPRGRSGAAVGTQGKQDAVPGGPQAPATAEGIAADRGPVGSSNPTGQGVGAGTPQQKEAPAAAAGGIASDSGQAPSTQLCSGAKAAIGRCADKQAREQAQQSKTAAEGAAADAVTHLIVTTCFPGEDAAAAAAGAPSTAAAAANRKKPAAPKKKPAASKPKAAAPSAAAAAAATASKPKAAAPATEAAVGAPASSSKKRPTPTDRAASPVRKRLFSTAAVAAAAAAAAAAPPPAAAQEPASPVYSNSGGLPSPSYHSSSKSGTQLSYGTDTPSVSKQSAAAGSDPWDEFAAAAAAAETPARSSSAAADPSAVAAPASPAVPTAQQTAGPVVEYEEQQLEFETEEELIAYAQQETEKAAAANARAVAAEEAAAAANSRAERAEFLAADAETHIAELLALQRRHSDLFDFHRQEYHARLDHFYVEADKREQRHADQLQWYAERLRTLHT